MEAIKMRSNQKPYRNKKPFKRKTGGPKFMLDGSGSAEVGFDVLDKNMFAGLSNLISLILEKKR